MINPKPCGHLCCCVIKGCEEVSKGVGEVCIQAVVQSVYRCWDITPILSALA